MNGRQPQVLVVDDEPNLRLVLSALLTRDGYEVLEAESGESAIEMLNDHHIDLVFSDLKMPGLDGMDVLRSALVIDPKLAVVIVTAHGTVDSAVEALKIGAFDFITKPFEHQEVIAIARKAIKSRELADDEASAFEGVAKEYSRYGILGRTQGILDTHDLITRVANTPSAVLVVGESGTGKELVARALHETSDRASRPFIRVNCSAIPVEHHESELFGIELNRGGMASPAQSRPGRVELADSGTLYLDEVSALSAEAQIKLLRLLQDREFERVGGVKTNRVDVRVVAGTQKDLSPLVEQGLFREELKYRLSVVRFEMEPLRRRLEDISLLVSALVRKFNQRLRKNVESVDEQAMLRLHAYPWPGNVRELEYVMERAMLFCDGSTLTADNLPLPKEALRSLSNQNATGLKTQVKAAMILLERELIEKALRQTLGNVTHSARLLKISRKGLQLKMKELGLREKE